MGLDRSCRVSCQMVEENSAALGSDVLDSLLIYQFNVNPERVRSLHIYVTNSRHEAVLQDFLLSPGGYCILRTPERKLLASGSAVAEHINEQSREFLAQGWISIFAFSVNLQLSTLPCPLLSPSKNPLLRALATLYPDLCFVEAVLANIQGTPGSLSSGMPSTPPRSSHVSPNPAPVSSSTSKRGFKVPRLDIPTRQSGNPGLDGELPRLREHTWDALLRKSNLLPETATPQEQWGQTVLTALAAAAPPNPSPNLSPVLTLDTPKPEMEVRTSTAHPTRNASYDDLLRAASLSSPRETGSFTQNRPDPEHDARVQSVNALLASLTAQNSPLPVTRGHQGIPLPSGFRVPTQSFNDAANISLSLPPPFFLPGPQTGPTADCAAAWSSRGGSTFAPQAARWPTAGFASLASQWSSAPGIATEQGWGGDGQVGAHRRSASLESNHSAAFSQSAPPSLQTSPNPTWPVTTAPQSTFPAHFALPQQSPTGQARLNLIELLVGAKESQRRTSDHFLSPSPAESSEPATPTPPTPGDLIGDAFAALEQGIPRPRPRSARSSGISSASSGSSLEDLRTAMSGSALLTPFDPASLVKQEQAVDAAASAADAAAFLEYKAQLDAMSSRGERVRQLTREEIAQFFDLPISEASKKLGVGLTMLKKRCRDLGIRRWPHRKLKSMKALIETVQQLGARHDDGPAQQIGSAIERLEAERESIEAAPTLKLTNETRKFRQACFKAKYKMRSQASRKSPTATSPGSGGVPRSGFQ